MFSKKFLKRERRLWHNHFVPSLIAAVFLGILAFAYETSFTNVILFASVGGSAAILTNTKSHHLTKLHTTLIAYFVTIVLTLVIYGMNLLISLSFPLNAGLLLFSIAITMFLVDAFHPPALTVGISFFMLHGRPLDLIFLFVVILVFLILIRLSTYVLSQHLPIEEFFIEFKKVF